MALIILNSSPTPNPPKNKSINNSKIQKNVFFLAQKEFKFL